jgi:hypothetical protein
MIQASDIQDRLLKESAMGSIPNGLDMRCHIRRLGAMKTFELRVSYPGENQGINQHRTYNDESRVIQPMGLHLLIAPQV